MCEALDSVAKKGSAGPNGLPPELVDVVRIVCAQLHGHVEPEDQVFLEDDIDYLLVRSDALLLAAFPLITKLV